jgi:hypothetical protein
MRKAAAAGSEDSSRPSIRARPYMAVRLQESVGASKPPPPDARHPSEGGGPLGFCRSRFEPAWRGLRQWTGPSRHTRLLVGARTLSGPPVVADLVERFGAHFASYKAGSYPETQVRREFIDPFFKALGWDIDNEQGFAEAYKDVVHEDSIRTVDGTKAPDYCFRVGGNRKFFVEAKRPSLNLRDDPSPAYQLRRYAWSSNLPLSILTDFEEFAVYDCRREPAPTDRASTARILYLRFSEYIDRWDEIAGRFSKQAILKGSFDQFAESTKAKRGTTTVDEAFLREIETWRSSLASNLALRNSDLSQPELNFAVQSTIDRIIFLRICEDRGIEPYGQLRNIAERSHVYTELSNLFRHADDKYNSGLFHFRKELGREADVDTLSLALHFDDRVLSELIGRLYYPQSPYAFSVLPADILGQVYEKFLGQVIRLTPAHRAVVEPKPEVRKAGGVYYTPTFVVESMIRWTLDSVLESATPRSVERLRILDPASGSGSFLLAAYQRLLDWHLNYYIEKSSKTEKRRIFQTAGGAWRLVIDEKKRILLNNIWGVDIDPQAVEVTKLSLLLKVLEGETDQSVHHQWKLLHDRALPDLSRNIKCGNSLIGSDFYGLVGAGGVSKEERARVSAFDWSSEFPEIVGKGGFDVVIGNPPYIFTRENFSDHERRYYEDHYNAGWEKRNTFMLFMERMIQLLAKEGKGSFIVPNSWLTIESARLLREIFASRIELLADLNFAVFEHVSMEPCIFVVGPSSTAKNFLAVTALSRKELVEREPQSVSKSAWEGADGRFVIAANSLSERLVESIVAGSIPLGSRFDVRTGLQAYEEGRGDPPQTAADVRDHVFDRKEPEDPDSYRYLQGADVLRDRINWSGMWMQYGRWLSQPRSLEMFTRPRVLVREITAPLPHCLNAAFTDDPLLSNKSVLTILHSNDDAQLLRILVAVLNSRCVSLFYKSRAVKSSRRVFPKIVIRNLREFPFPKHLDGSLPERILSLASQAGLVRLELEKERVPSSRTARERELEVQEHALETAICEAYGLNRDDAAMVFEATRGS